MNAVMLAVTPWLVRGLDLVVLGVLAYIVVGLALAIGRGDY